MHPGREGYTKSSPMLSWNSSGGRPVECCIIKDFPLCPFALVAGGQAEKKQMKLMEENLSEERDVVV